MRILFIAFIFLVSCSGKDDTSSKVDIFSQKGILLLDNYLSHDDFKTLKDTIFSTEFPWFHNENIVTDDELLKNSNGIPFYYQVHLVYKDNKPNSTFYDSIKKYFDFALSFRVKWQARLDKVIGGGWQTWL